MSLLGVSGRLDDSCFVFLLLVSVRFLFPSFVHFVFST